MAYVEPSGIIQLMKGVNLDNRYGHTIYFENVSAQNTYFSSKVTHTFEKQSYTRHNSNVVRVKVATDAVADCTYMRFQNKNNGKWYYAFINYVDYINENVTAITFEIDVMQTWFFQTGHDIKPCYVDREHVNDDTFGIYHAPETPKTDELHYNKIGSTGWFDYYSLIIQTSQSPQAGYYYDNGTFSGCNITHIPNIDSEQLAEQAAQILETMLGGSWDKNVQSANVVDMYNFPSVFADRDATQNVKDYNLSKPSTFTYANGNYTPKNNRLFSNPYCLLLVTDLMGENSLYEWEQFNNPSSITFTFRGNPNGGGSIMCYPRNYAGVDHNYDSAILMKNFPKVAYSYDAYEAWVASGGLTKMSRELNLVQMQGVARKYENIGADLGIVKSGVSTVGEGLKTLVTGGANFTGFVGSAAGTAQTIANATAGNISREVAQKEAENNLIYEFKDAQYQPDIVFGQISSDLGVSQRILDFNFLSVYPKKDEAIRIDDFFSTYGYSIKEVKQPNLTGRKHWNFLKTRGAVIGGNMPSSSRRAIADIIDGGIFFWKNGDEIGNFRVEVTNGSINNPIL